MPDFVPMPTVTALYAGLLGLMSIVIGFIAGHMRGGQDGVSIGDGGKYEMVVAMRRHSNFVEWTPMALILIALLEMNKIPINAIHALGAMLVIGRACHAFGLRADGTKMPFRVAGALLSTLVTLVASVWAIVTY